MSRLLDITGRCMLGLMLASVLISVSGGASAKVTETILYAFKGGNDGEFPFGGLLLLNGNLYGTTKWGGGLKACGPDGCGTVFELTSAGKESVLHAFDYATDGQYPVSSLIADSAGNLYGTTSSGGPHQAGTVFELGPSGAETVLHVFCSQPVCADGALPESSLIEDAASNIFGTTFAGGIGCVDGCGTLFKLAPNGTETVLYNFCSQLECKDGRDPAANVMEDKSGNFFGTAAEGVSQGCSSGCGTVFEFTAAGKLVVLHTFCARGRCNDGGDPVSGLIEDSAGNLYGTAYAEGNAKCNCGAVFKITSAGAFSVLHTFVGGSDGANPQAGLMMDAAGTLYGTTIFGGAHDFGTVFQIGPNGVETVLHAFADGHDGYYPAAGLIADSAGNLYGATTNGGTYSRGTVFKVTL